jgi:hypothetical protein
MKLLISPTQSILLPFAFFAILGAPNQKGDLFELSGLFIGCFVPKRTAQSFGGLSTAAAAEGEFGLVLRFCLYVKEDVERKTEEFVSGWQVVLSNNQ